jgi:alpha-N-arabinofuranosidase
LTPVRWEEGWPIVSPGVGRVECEHPLPDLPEQRWPSVPACDHFEEHRLAHHWNLLRTPRDAFYSLTERPGYLRLSLRPEKLSEWANPSFVGRRQQHMHFAARTAREFTPQAANECAGMVLLQNSDFHFRLVITSGERGTVVRLIQRKGTQDRGTPRFEPLPAEETSLAEQPLTAGRVYLKVEAHGQA